MVLPHEDQKNFHQEQRRKGIFVKFLFADIFHCDILSRNE